MTGKTHRAGGMLGCFIGYSVLQQNGLLVEGVNPFIQIAVMYPFSLWGSMLLDQDHNEDSAPCKDIISISINRVLHLQTPARQALEKATKKDIPQHPFRITEVFDARHRSWQTHSDLFLAIFIFLFIRLVMTSQQTLDVCILRMILSGTILGIISHIILDMLTPEGIWSIVTVAINKIRKIKKMKFPKLPEKISFLLFLPKSKLVSKFFATEGPWEKIVNKLLWFANYVYLALLIYEVLPYKIVLNF